MNSLNEDETPDDTGGGVGSDPACEPIGIAFTPISDTVEAATNHLSNQSLLGLVYITSPATNPCTFNITSTIPTVVVVQPQVTIPVNFTTAPVYGIFRANTSVKTPSVYISAVAATPATSSSPGNITPPVVYARILVPGTTYNPQITEEESDAFVAAVAIQSISFDPATVKGGDSSTGTVTLVSKPSEDTKVYLSVNQDYQPYFHVPPSVTVLAHSNTATVSATVSSPTPAFTLLVYGQTGDNLPVASNTITITASP